MQLQSNIYLAPRENKFIGKSGPRDFEAPCQLFGNYILYLLLKEKNTALSR